MELLTPCSPYCNPLVFYICSVCGQDVYKVPHNTAASQMIKVLEVMMSLLRDTMANTCSRSSKSIKDMEEAAGKFLCII